MDISSLLPQTITYWEYSSVDGWGVVTYIAPTSISGRWEDKQELFIDETGREVRSQAVVYLNQDVTLKGYLYLGDSAESIPISVSGAKEIRAFLKSPSIDGTQFLRKIWL